MSENISKNLDQRDFSYRLLKRLFDVAFSILFISVFSPIYIFSAIKIYLDDRGSPIYTQKRVGKNKKIFTAYKFRSMVINADEIMMKNKEIYEQLRSGNNKIINDPRITPFGKFIRKYSIDEFPQMFNVLLGQMSIIGPRPLRPDEFELAQSKSTEIANELEIISTVKPGITGYWQTYGRSKINFEERMKMEAYYSQKKSFVFDLIIFVRTPFAILKGEGAY